MLYKPSKEVCFVSCGKWIYGEKRLGRLQLNALATRWVLEQSLASDGVANSGFIAFLLSICGAGNVTLMKDNFLMNDIRIIFFVRKNRLDAAVVRDS